MLKHLLFSLLFSHVLFGAYVQFSHWEIGDSFEDYLTSRNIPANLIESISDEDKKFLSDMLSDSDFYELYDADASLRQALIPIGEEMQIHLFKTPSGSYGFDIVPIKFKSAAYFAKVKVEESLYSDTNKTVGNEEVARQVSFALQGVLDENNITKGDEVAFTYRQKTRLGRVFSRPHLEMIHIITQGVEHYIFVDDEGYGYKEEGGDFSYKVKEKVPVKYKREVEVANQFRMPVRNVRVTSHFNPRRWHPILKRYRPHHGTDFGGRTGTPLLAVASGKVTFSGWMGGYGKVVKVRHSNGYESLYAHMSRRRVSVGKYVKQGQIVGHLGNTGRSTGPHLHFGLKRNGRWVNPMRYLSWKKTKRIMKTFTEMEEETVTKTYEIDTQEAHNRKQKLLEYVNTGADTFVWTQEKLDGTI